VPGPYRRTLQQFGQGLACSVLEIMHQQSALAVPNAGPPVVSISMTRESPSASGLLHAAIAFSADAGAGKPGATALVSFCATAVGAKGAAPFVASAKCSGVLSLLAAASVFCEDGTRAAAAIGGTGFCATMTPNATSPNVSNAAKTTKKMRIQTPPLYLLNLVRSES
jgi:hypothetical protein